MSGFFGLENKEVVRIKVKKCDGMMQPEYKKFSIDPQINSFEMLHGILARAFDIQGDFTISYLAKDNESQDVYLSMLSDWDLDAAIQCAGDPCLRLKVDLKPFEEAPNDIPQHKVSTVLDKGSILGSITGTISNQVGRTVSSMQRAMGLKGDDEQYKPSKPAMTDSEFRNYLDSIGVLIKPQEFRLGIYQGGIEPSLRRVAWRHLCNIYPANLSGKERFDYMKQKEKDYYKLRDEWKERFRNDTATEEVKYVASMVTKDVLRTDRGHKFYAGSDDNENISSLLNILVTYALTHPDVSYCQGMSDIASPILVTQKDEAQAYLCFCGLMKRLKNNFMPDGAAIMLKFKHLGLLLHLHDPDFYTYLQQIGANDLFFCYRWLLLELKREFPFEDALYMKEVMWSTLPPDPPSVELELTDPDYSVHLLSTSPCSPTFSFQQTVYAKLLAMRRHGSSQRMAANNELIPGNSANNNSMTNFDTSPSEEHGLIRSQDFPCIDDPITKAMQETASNIDKRLHDKSPMETENNMENIKRSQNDKSLTDDINQINGIHENQTNQSYDSSNGNCESTTLTKCSISVTEPTVLDKTNIGNEETVEETESSGARQEGEAGRSLEPESEQQTQFYISLEASGETTPSTPKQTLKNDSGGFFSNMKRIMSSPKRRPNNISIKEASNSTDNSHRINSVTENAVRNSTSHLETSHSSLGSSKMSDSHISDCVEAMESPMSSSRASIKLPPPEDFGCGNPFLMFLCLGLMLQHRDYIMGNNMDYEEVAMYFDKMVRRHNVHRVLYTARQLYSDYLRVQQNLVENSQHDDDSGFSV
ncbi:TBC1 domain family member 25 isoform X2 [Patella vulgata]|uniref:TBC1 domain family member 25 isoform X2 n=1 Tax=Patella vulgata TaxID=6465 RepID=UPI00217F4BF3|nr:TBC1 domain family member 25 isoform X2 [Patella vulgata]